MDFFDILCNTALRVGKLRGDYIEEEDYDEPYPIDGIPAMLLEDDGGDFLHDMVVVHQETVDDNEGVDPDILEEKEMAQFPDDRGDEKLETIHNTLLYKSNHLRAQLSIPLDDTNIIFPGPKNHDLPRVNIAFKPNPNWSNKKLTNENESFGKWYWNYESTIDAYNFTMDPVRLENARTLSSTQEHPFHPFFLEKRYINLHQKKLKVRIANLLNEKKEYWMPPSFD